MSEQYFFMHIVYCITLYYLILFYTNIKENYYIGIGNFLISP